MNSPPYSSWSNDSLIVRCAWSLALVDDVDALPLPLAAADVVVTAPAAFAPLPPLVKPIWSGSLPVRSSGALGPSVT